MTEPKPEYNDGAPKVNSLVASLIAVSGQDNIVVVHKAFVKFTGSLEAGLLLGQLLYWTPRGQIGGGWIAKNDEECASELCISVYGVRKARTALEKLGILETRVAKFGGTPMLHYRIRQDQLTVTWTAWVNSDSAKPQSPLCDTKESDSAKSQDQPCEIVDSLTEITPETTAEINTGGANAPTVTDTPESEPEPKPEPEPEPQPITPSTFQGWVETIRDSANRPAVLRAMFATLYGGGIPETDLPTYAYIGRAARTVGGASRLAELLWQHSTRPPTGDVLAYLMAVAKNGGKGNGTYQQGNGNRQERGRWTAEDAKRINAQVAAELAAKEAAGG